MEHDDDEGTTEDKVKNFSDSDEENDESHDKVFFLIFCKCLNLIYN